MKNRQKRLRLGFTLVELVMVIVVIGMLSAIIVPRFMSQRDKAGIATTKANLESLRTAIALYYAQEGTWPGITNTLETDLQSGEVTNTQYMRRVPDETVDNPPSSAVAAAYSGNGGWVWDPTAADPEIYPNFDGPNANGTDADGTLYSEY